MKKIVALVAAMVLLCSALPMISVQAFTANQVYSGVSGCRLTGVALNRAENPWLMWDVGFAAYNDGRVFETTSDHPNLIGRAAIFTLRYEGARVSFNGADLVSGQTAVLLKEQNDLIVYAGDQRAEYQISVTEVNHGLPVVAIDTANVAINSKEEYVSSSVSIYGGSTSYSGNNVYAASAGVKLRGNSTMGYDKKPYRIKFDSKQNVLDMGKAKSWTLIANYLDPAQMRNRVAYSFAAKMDAMSFAPRMRPVEVYLNGSYLGLYDLGDQIQVNSLRIDIPEDTTGTETNTTGFHLEVEARAATDTDPYFSVNGGGSYQSNMYFQIKTPSDPLSDTQFAYIQAYIENINQLILNHDTRVWDYVDMASVVDWYLSNEVFNNADSALCSSCVMYKTPDTVDEQGRVTAAGKLYFGPVWDFDISMGGVVAVGSPTGWRTRNDGYSAWFNRLFETTVFNNAVVARYQQIRQTAVQDIFSDINTLSAEIDEAARFNHEKWFSNFVAHQSDATWDKSPILAGLNSWEEQVQFLSSYMQTRINWLDQQFGIIDSPSSLYGQPVISGLPEYGSRLVTDTNGILPNWASRRYQWTRDGVDISGATASSYTPVAADIGHAVAVRVSVANVAGTLTSRAVTIRKTTYTYRTSQVPTLISKTTDTIVALERENYELSLDGVHWQTSGTFTGLSPNTYYRVYYRHGETATQTGGSAGTPLRVITNIDPTPVYAPGDVNRDGVLTSVDARLTLIYAVSSQGLDEQQIALADYNADGFVNTLDVRGLLLAAVAA